MRTAPRAPVLQTRAYRRSRCAKRSLETCLERAAQVLNRAGCPLLALSLELLADALAFEIGQIVDEKTALEMIHLVLQTHRERAVQVALEHGALLVAGPDADLRRPLDVVEDARNRQTSLLARAFAFARENLRVDEDLRIVALVGDVDDHDALVHIDLRRRKADPRGRIHRLEQVIDEPL